MKHYLPQDLEISFSRSRGKGGQNVNKVESAVRIKHLPSGLVVRSESERSQSANRQTALKRLNEKLIIQKQQAEQKKKAALALARARRRRPGPAEKQRLLASKKRHSLKKQGRRKLDD